MDKGRTQVPTVEQVVTPIGTIHIIQTNSKLNNLIDSKIKIGIDKIEKTEMDAIIIEKFARLIEKIVIAITTEKAIVGI